MGAQTETAGRWDDTDVVHLHDAIAVLADGLADVASQIIVIDQDGETESTAVRSVWIWEHGWTLQSNCVLEQSDHGWCDDKCRDVGYASGSAKAAIPLALPQSQCSAARWHRSHSFPPAQTRPRLRRRPTWRSRSAQDPAPP